MSQESATQVVPLTPQGRGAVAAILVEGAAAAEQVGRYFFGHSEAPLAVRPLNRILHGRWGSSDGEDVVVCRRGETEIEIHCHGGNVAAERIVSDLIATGCEPLPWIAWVRGRELSRIRADAREFLAQARTERTAAILVDQFLGALETALDGIVRALDASNANTARDGLQALLARSSVGLHLVEPWRVVLAGPPNVGKSSLINALVGYRRSIVFDQPGTTRDVVSVTTAIDGWPIELSDTAGLRPSDDPLEAAGVALARRQLAAADYVVLVFDVTERWTEACEALIGRHPEAIVVFNKVDLLTEGVRCVERGADAPYATGASALRSTHPTIATSAVTGQGIDELAEMIVRQFVSNEPRPGEAVPFTAFQVAQLRAALDAISRGDLSTARSSVARMSSSGSPFGLSLSLSLSLRAEGRVEDKRTG